MPGRRDLELIRQVCAECPLPVNVMAGQEARGFGAGAEACVRRISYGPFLWRAVMATLMSYAAGAFREV